MCEFHCNLKNIHYDEFNHNSNNNVLTNTNSHQYINQPISEHPAIDTLSKHSGVKMFWQCSFWQGKILHLSSYFSISLLKKKEYFSFNKIECIFLPPTTITIFQSIKKRSQSTDMILATHYTTISMRNSWRKSSHLNNGFHNKTSTFNNGHRWMLRTNREFCFCCQSF